LSKFLKHVLFAIIGIVVLLLLVFQILKGYTHHNEKITVPDLKEASLDQVKTILKQKKLRYKISDTAYNADIPAGAIIDQNPRPNFKVKQKRTIYLVVNSDTPPPVKMPDLIDNPIRQAEFRLQNKGLKVGKRTYKPDIAKDVVLEVLYNGKPIQPGETIYKGETVDLVLGDGFGNTTMDVPDLIGLEYQEAVAALSGYSLNPGKVVFDGDIANRNTAIVVDQSPSSSTGKKVNIGGAIDIFLTENPES